MISLVSRVLRKAHSFESSLSNAWSLGCSLPKSKKFFRQLTIGFCAKKTQDIFYNALKASNRAELRRMNDYSTFSGCLTSIPRNAGFPTSDNSNDICTGSYHNFRHFSGLSGLGVYQESRLCFSGRL